MLKGNGDLVCLQSEGAARLNARRSIVAAKIISKGEVITRDMVTFKRPGTGISPSDLEKVLGKKAAVNIAADDILQWDEIEK